MSGHLTGSFGVARGVASARGGQKRTLTLVDRLGRQIVTGAFDGTRFPTEADLAAQHGVSRSVTREAVRMLTAKGLLSARPRTGTAITPARGWNLFDPDVLDWLMERQFSLDLLRQFTEVRIAVEPQAAALAARVADADALRAIAAGLESMRSAANGQGDALAADIGFHAAILTAAGNPFYDQLRDLVAAALRTSIRFTNRFAGRTASIPAHKAVLDAISARDAPAAKAAMAAIIDEVLDLIRTAQDGDGVTVPPPEPAI